jgi:molybdopterin-binding protein
MKVETKFYKRGVRTFYMIAKNKVMRIVNGGYKSEVTILTGDDTCYKMVASMITEDALEGTEITPEEFAKEFEVASRLIVLEP